MPRPEGAARSTGGPRSLWKGSVSFGLVNVPVQMHAATREKGVHFNQLHRTDGGRVRYRLTCEACGQELERDDIVKGHETGVGYATFEDDELAELSAAAAEGEEKTIRILDFVDLAEVDPIYVQKGYYLSPQKGAATAYALLRDAMGRTGKVALATFIRSGSKSHLALLRSRDDVLVLETMYYGDEVIPPETIPVPQAKPSDRELEMAVSLIERYGAEFEPGRYHDAYRERLEEVIQRKIEGQQVVVPAGHEEPTEIRDLMAALEASLRKSPARGAEPEFAAAMPDEPEPPAAERKPRRRKSSG